MQEDAPIEQLLQQAVAMREAADKPRRKGFDKLPAFMQNTLVVSDEVVAARELQFEERMAFAMDHKAKGNALFREGKLFDAVHCYEEALAVFRFLENKNTDWRTKGIEDADIVRCDATPSNGDEAAQLRDFFASCYVNLAIVLFKLGDYMQCIQACDAAIKEAPNNAKVYFKRAQARMATPSAGATEYELALGDLSQASRLAPDDRTVQKEYTRVRREQAAQVAKDKKTFAGMFERGAIYDHDSSDNCSNDGSHVHRTHSSGCSDSDRIDNPQHDQGTSSERIAQTRPSGKGRIHWLPWVVGVVAGVSFFVWRLWQLGFLQRSFSDG